jgi:hypothetical protein
MRRLGTDAAPVLAHGVAPAVFQVQRSMERRVGYTEKVILE